VGGWTTLLDKCGATKLEQVLAPAIQYAEQGFPVSEIVGPSVRPTRVTGCTSSRDPTPALRDVSTFRLLPSRRFPSKLVGMRRFIASCALVAASAFRPMDPGFRRKSVSDYRNRTHGDAAFADYALIFGLTRRF
jgi:hypothetical protein